MFPRLPCLKFPSRRQAADRDGRVYHWNAHTRRSQWAAFGDPGVGGGGGGGRERRRRRRRRKRPRASQAACDPGSTSCTSSMVAAVGLGVHFRARSSRAPPRRAGAVASWGPMMRWWPMRAGNSSPELRTACWYGPLGPRCARAAGAGQAKEHHTEEFMLINSDWDVLEKVVSGCGCLCLCDLHLCKFFGQFSHMFWFSWRTTCVRELVGAVAPEGCIRSLGICPCCQHLESGRT